MRRLAPAGRAGKGVGGLGVRFATSWLNPMCDATESTEEKLTPDMQHVHGAQGPGSRPTNGLREANGRTGSTLGSRSGMAGGGGGARAELGASSAESSPAPSEVPRRGGRPPVLEPLLCGASEESSDSPPTATPATPPTAPGSTVRAAYACSCGHVS